MLSVQKTGNPAGKPVDNMKNTIAGDVGYETGRYES